MMFQFDAYVAQARAGLCSTNPFGVRRTFASTRSSWLIRQLSIFWGVLEHALLVLRVLGAIDHLRRIVFKVEEQRRQGGEVHVLVTLAAQCAQGALVGCETEHLRPGALEDVAENRTRRCASRRHRAGVSPARKGTNDCPSHCGGTSIPSASRIVGITSTFSVKELTWRPRPGAAAARGSRTMSGTWKVWSK